MKTAHPALNSAEALLMELLNGTTMSSTLIGVDEMPGFEPGGTLSDAVYEQLGRFNSAMKAARSAGTMTEKQALMFECRLIRSMRQLCLAQNNLEARGLDAHVRSGQGTILFVRENGTWFTKMNRSSDILCVGAYLAACSRKTSAWTFLLFTEEGDTHAS